MILTDGDHGLLAEFFPDLQYDPAAQRIIGELSFCAAYDRATGKLNVARLEHDDAIRGLDSFLCDAFEIEIRLDARPMGANGWPTVLEVGGRRRTIAERCGVAATDLHFFADGACCLGIRLTREQNLSLERFLYERVIPFFYRLSYTEYFGIDATRRELWGEYSHGDAGYAEHRRELDGYARSNSGRNAPCPCGSGRKYKLCCLDEVKAAIARAEC